MNIQSLQSKFEQLSSEIAELSEKNILIEVIALQEVWDIRYPELFCLLGFKPLICKVRQGMRGGGVGFYVKEYLDVEILENLSSFENKIFEALTLKITYPDKKVVIISSVYRSNGILPNVTPTQQMDRFLEKFADLLMRLQNTNSDAYVCMDSNIDLLKLHQPTSSNFLNLILEKSFLPAIAKATRCQNASKTLIDQILFNKNCRNLISGTIVSDTSDHFITFIAPPGRIKNVNACSTSIVSRDYSTQNLNLFKSELSLVNWDDVYNCRDVNMAYNEFWNVYKNCHDASFPLKRKRFNKNIHKKNPFMTLGLLTSRNSKNKLHKISIAEPTGANIQKYKQLKSLYSRVLRGAKKLYFTSKLAENAKNQKKTWETLNKILGKAKQKESLNKINIENVCESDPLKIADHFNGFFT